MDDDRAIFNRTPPPPYSEDDPSTRPPQYVTEESRSNTIQNPSDHFVAPTVDDDNEFIRSSVPVEDGRVVAAVSAFHWNITRWSRLKKINWSMVFDAGGTQWQLKLMLKGNRSTGNVSIYLCHVPTDRTANRKVYASFSFAISNAKVPSIVAVESTSHEFTHVEDDFGFTGFIDKADLRKRLPGYTRPLLVEDRLRISVYLRVYHYQDGLADDSDSDYEDISDSEEIDQPAGLRGRSQAGFLGLANDSASLYMNSLVLSLYHIPMLRMAVARIDRRGGRQGRALGHALRTTFESLRVDDSPPDASAIVAALQDQYDELPRTATIQHYMRLLCENLGQRMRGTQDEGIIDSLFMGLCRTTTKCLDVNYHSSRSEPIYDLSLNINVASTLQEAIDAYCAPEILRGDNRYLTNSYGYQDATRSIGFEKLPPVLHIHLNRFEYDVSSGALRKSSHRLKYAMHLNLAQHLTLNADRSQTWPYALHGILLHTGDTETGRHFCILRPRIADEWFCFEDDLVYPVSSDFVLDATDEVGHGVDQDDSRVRDHQRTSRFKNAYMLVYIRTTMLTQIFGFQDSLPRPPPPPVAPAEPRASSSISRQSDEQLTAVAYVITHDQVVNHQGFDLCNHPNIGGLSGNSLVELFVPLTATTAELRSRAASSLGCRPDEFRFWCMTPRVNKTLRCEMPMAWSSTTTVKDLMKYHGTSSNSLYLYCELRVLSDPVFFGRIPIPQGVTMIHLKFYNPAEGKMIGLGHIYVNARLPIKTILPILCQKAGLAKKTELLLYEEIKPWLIEAIDPKKKFEQVELQLGDIICFQAKASADLQTTEARAHPKLITGFFDRLAARLRVQNEGRNH